MEHEFPRTQGPQPDPDRRKPALRRWLRHLQIVIALMLLAAITGAMAVGNYISRLVPDTPGIEELLDARISQPSILLSADGSLLGTFSRGVQEQVTLDRVSPHVIDALIATEDHRFYDHRGVDVLRTAAALLRTAGGDAQGGSTITQQLARNLFPEEIGRSRTIERKLREIITAVKIEQAYTKDQILETYLNSVPFLYNVIGIEMAARTYFNKPASELDVPESATLIGMLKGTSYYNPVLNPERARQRRNIVLSQMAKHGVLSSDQLAALRELPLQVNLTRQSEPLRSAPHFAAHVRRQLIEWADANDYNLYTDGLVITTTLDDRMQEAATEAVERQAQALQDIADVEWSRTEDSIVSHSPSAYTALRKKAEPFRHFWEERAGLLDAFIRESRAFRKAVAAGRSETAALAALKEDDGFMRRLRAAKTRLETGFIAIDPGSGEVKAWVGSRDFEHDQFDHVAQAARQPGSTFKPIVYGAALEHGFDPDRAYPDGEVEIPTPEGGIWKPTDMGGFSGRMMSMREGLILSKNTITAQVMQDVGAAEVVGLARAAGIRQSRLDPVPSLSLGTSPVTLFEMASAYSTIARVGEYRAPVMIRKIADRDGNVLAEFGSEARRAMSRDTAIELIDMLRGVVRQGTGAEARERFRITGDIAGKTGTTQNNTDGWFFLMHPDLVAGAWVGFNDPRVTMRSDYWGQGGHNAALLVGDFFRNALKARLVDVKAKFPQPKRRPPPLMVQAPVDDWQEQVADGMNRLPAGYGTITRHGSETTVVIGPDGVQAVRRRDAPNAQSSGGSWRGRSASGGEDPRFPEVGH